MSFLDPVRDTLNPVIFNENGEMDARFRDQMEGYVNLFVPKEGVHKIYLLGSSAGFQYSRLSDIDLTVFLKPGYDRKKYHKLKGSKPTTTYGKTQHELTVFFVDYIETPNFEDAVYAVYNITDNKWVVDPKKIKYDPKVRFEKEIYFANKVMSSIQSIYKRYEFNKKQLLQLKPHTSRYEGIKKQLEQDIEKLVAHHRKIDRDRKTSYYGGWGTPRESQQNILYKIYEYNKMKKVVEQLHKEFGDEIPNIL